MTIQISINFFYKAGQKSLEFSEWALLLISTHRVYILYGYDTRRFLLNRFYTIFTQELTKKSDKFSFFSLSIEKYHDLKKERKLFTPFEMAVTCNEMVVQLFCLKIVQSNP